MSNLENIIKNKIIKLGPMSVKDFYNFVLYNDKQGYYSKQNIVGKKGDFVTSPEISQLFGEVIAFWMILYLNKFDLNKEFNLCELGPGKGTLMSDILRTIKNVDDRMFVNLKKIFFLESSFCFLKTLKRKFLKAQIDDDIGKIPKGKNIIIANEFFDAVPVRQYIYQKNHWYERLVSLNEKEKLQFTLSKKIIKPNFFFPKKPINGQTFEISEYIINILDILCENIKKFGGILLIIDYAKNNKDLFSTLSAINDHKHVNPFYKLGESDISFKPDYNLISKIVHKNFCKVHGPVTQSKFLQTMGIKQRAESLIKQNPLFKEKIQTELKKLISSEFMGNTFKVICVSDKKQKEIAGFDE